MAQPRNPLKLQGVGLGTFPFSNVFGTMTAAEAERITYYYLNHGGSYIQTAPYYEGGEILLGKILKSVPRDSYRLATLCVQNSAGNRSNKRAHLISQCETSLRQLQTDYLDLLMPSTTKATDAPMSEAIATLEDLKQQGKIRAIGVCNVSLAQLKEYATYGQIDYVQNRMSLIDQEIDREVRNYCEDQGIGLIPYNVIEWGILTNKMLDDWQLRHGDLRTKVLPVFNSQPKTILHNWIVQELKPLAEARHTTIEAMAISWALGQPAVVTAPVGATSLAQITASLQVTELENTTDLYDKLQHAYESLRSKITNEFRQDINDFLKNSYGKW